MKLNPKEKKANRYSLAIEEVFRRHYKKGSESVEFYRDELEAVLRELGQTSIKNLGDNIYSFRFRTELPESIRKTAPKGREWVIELAGRKEKRTMYRFELQRINRIRPAENKVVVKIPDATPEIIARYALTDEQALLAKVRYNRLIDIFLGITSYSLQNHLRTTLKTGAQIEVDELYVGVNRHGAQYIVPVQAKGGSDVLGPVQVRQDVTMCEEKYPELLCRPVASQFMSDDVIAMFELVIQDGEVRIVDEKHYKLVAHADVTADDLRTYRLSLD